MLGFARKTETPEHLEIAIDALLQQSFDRNDSSLSELNQWSRRRIVAENKAKLALTLEADDPSEYCYQNLIREINYEAEVGIFLADASSRSAACRDIARDPGVSGMLWANLSRVANTLFSEQLQNGSTVSVWSKITRQYDRARTDVAASEMILRDLGTNENAVADMTSALRSLLYSFHEDVVRRRCGLPTILSDSSTRELMVMVADIEKRAGDYSQRRQDIEARAASNL